MDLATDGTRFSGSGTLSAANMAGLLAGQTYLNVHTAANPGGEIRGQVPEPSSICLSMLGLICLSAFRRRAA
jgi:hypothetical protein